MNIKITKSALIDGLKKVSGIIANNAALPVTMNVKLEATGKEVTLTTTDLDVTTIAKVECEVVGEGSTTLPAKMLLSISSCLADGIVQIEVDDKEKATILGGTAKYRLQGLPASQFPEVPAAVEGHSFTASKNLFANLLNYVDYAASNDETRRTLRGVLLKIFGGKITTVATDGRRLATIEEELKGANISDDIEFILPRKSVSEIKKHLSGDGEVTISHSASQCVLGVDGFTLMTRLIDDKYPNYQQVIPSSTETHIDLDREAFLSAIDRVSVLAKDNPNIKLTFANNMCVIEATDADIGAARDEIPCKYEGAEIVAVYNPFYLQDPIKQIKDDEFKFNVTDGHSPAVITCSLPFKYVLMPLRMN